jgi:thiazolinyl imide reductase
LSVPAPHRKLRTVVCGTKFGRIYLAAFRNKAIPFELVGIVGQGSDRSHACANAYKVPLYRSAKELPDDIEAACVVVGAGINGGKGCELALELMSRGIHVLQEHPLHHDELGTCLRAARRYGVHYHLNTHYRHIAPIRRFVAAVRALRGKQAPLFVEAASGIQVLYTLLDLLGEALGGLHPWSVGSALSATDRPFAVVHTTMAGVPVTLRVQNELNPSDPDNYAHLLHHVMIGTEGGTMTLVSTHGPIIWTPRAHLPDDAKIGPYMENSSADHLDEASATILDPSTPPTYRTILSGVWPNGVERALREFHRSLVNNEDVLLRGQYYLTLCKLWQGVTAQLGYPTLASIDVPNVLSAEPMRQAIAVSDTETTEVIK